VGNQQKEAKAKIEQKRLIETIQQTPMPRITRPKPGKTIGKCLAGRHRKMSKDARTSGIRRSRKVGQLAKTGKLTIESSGAGPSVPLLATELSTASAQSRNEVIGGEIRHPLPKLEAFPFEFAAVVAGRR
jgi:hypothetical protein